MSSSIICLVILTHLFDYVYLNLMHAVCKDDVLFCYVLAKVFTSHFLPLSHLTFNPSDCWTDLTELTVSELIKAFESLFCRLHYSWQLTWRSDVGHPNVKWNHLLNTNAKQANNISPLEQLTLKIKDKDSLIPHFFCHVWLIFSIVLSSFGLQTSPEYKCVCVCVCVCVRERERERECKM